MCYKKCIYLLKLTKMLQFLLKLLIERVKESTFFPWKRKILTFLLLFYYMKTHIAKPEHEKSSKRSEQIF